MSAQLVVTPGESFPDGQPVDLAALRRASKPTVNPQSVDVASIPDGSLTTAKWADNDFDMSVKGKDKSVTNAKLGDAAVTAAKVQADAYSYATATLSGTVYGFALTPTGCNPAAYADGQQFWFLPNAANPGACQVNVNSLGAVNLKKFFNGAAVDPAVGDIVANHPVGIIYRAASPTPYFVMVSPSARRSTPVIGSARNLVVQNNGGSGTNKIAVTADEVVLKDANGNAFLVSGVSLTVDIADTQTGSAANGRDQSTAFSANWIYLWVISDGTTTSGLVSLSASAPTLPTGYVYKALVSVVRWSGTALPANFYQHDRTVWVPRTNVLSGGAGNGSYQSVNPTTVLPPEAKRAIGDAQCAQATSASGSSPWAMAASVSLAADTAGTGGRTIAGAVTVTASASPTGYTVAGSYELPLKTAATLYWNAASTVTVSVWVNGYVI